MRWFKISGLSNPSRNPIVQFAEAVQETDVLYNAVVV
jgi:hypothetical protein